MSYVVKIIWHKIKYCVKDPKCPMSYVVKDPKYIERDLRVSKFGPKSRSWLSGVQMCS